jgi:hypothetical protein
LRPRERVILEVSLALVLTALAASVLGTVSSLVQMNKTISNSGSITGVGVGIYWNSICTNKTTTINWGLIDPGSAKTITLYVRNEGNAAALLTKSVDGWSPSAASNYLTLNWDYADQTINVNQVLQIKLTLSVSSAITGIANFGFNVTILATTS